MRVLLLGGTSEAFALAGQLAALARYDVTLSLAGRTETPRPQPLPTRIGGFGGVEGLAHWLAAHGIAAVIDATHPFAARISANAVAACAQLALPLGSLVRPPWRREPGDDWRLARDAAQAAELIGPAPRRVFLGVGRLELARFAAAPQHDYLARTIDDPGAIDLPPRLELIRDRGPFNLAREVAMLRQAGIEIVVSKNSGGPATYAKIAAARALGLPVIMIERPHKPAGTRLADAETALAWLSELANHAPPPLSRLGV